MRRRPDSPPTGRGISPLPDRGAEPVTGEGPAAFPEPPPRGLREGRKVFCLNRHRPPAVGKWRGPLCGQTAPDSLGPATLITGPAITRQPGHTAGPCCFLAWGCRSTTGRSRPRRQPPDNGVRETELTQEAPQPGPSRRASTAAVRLCSGLSPAGRFLANVVATLSRALPASPAPLPIPTWMGAPTHLRQAGKEVQRSHLFRAPSACSINPAGHPHAPWGRGAPRFHSI